MRLIAIASLLVAALSGCTAQALCSKKQECDDKREDDDPHGPAIDNGGLVGH